ncbi:MAG: CHAT domain-containing protein [Crocinitomicaceae bacterium]|nr:CHAT domain-containing protein [Crocinitomicaceae bacterium]
MRRKLIIFIVLIAGMSGLFLAQEAHSNQYTITQNSGAIKAQLDSLLSLIDRLSNNGEYQQILDEVDRAEKIVLTHKQDSFYLSVFRQHKGNAFYWLGDYGKAIEGFNDAITANGNNEAGLKQRATQFFDRANAEYQLEMMTDCYQSTLASEAILTKLENPDYDYLISVYNDLAYQSRELAFYDDARMFLTKARSVYESKKDLVDTYNLPVRKPVSFAYSEVLINAEDKDEKEMLNSLTELEQLVDTRTSTKQELVRLSSAYNAVADFYINDLHSFTQEKYQNAKRYLALTKSTLNVDENPGGLDQLRFNEAKMAYNIGTYSEAKAKFEKLSEELAIDDPRRPFFETMKGLVNLKLKRSKGAEANFFRTLEITHSGRDSLLTDCSNYQASTNIIHATLFAEVADTIKKYDEQLFDRVGSKLQLAGMREFEANYQGKTFNSRLKSTYESLFQGMLDPMLDEPNDLKKTSLYADLLNQSETIENRLLWSKFLLNRRLGQLKVPDSIRRKEQVLRLNIVQARRGGDAQACFELENELEKLERSILADYPKYGTFSQSHFDVKGLQKDLAKETLIIKYVELNKEYYRFDIDNRTIKCTKIERPDALKKQIEMYLSVIRNRKQDRELARSLSSLLLPDDYSKYSKLVFVNNLIWEELPFEALCNKQKNYLVESTLITYSPHLVFINNEHESEGSNGDVVVFTPSYANGQTNLRGAQDESELISDCFGSKYFNQNKATRSAFLDASTNASVLHLAMHAEINENIGEQSCFLFNDEKLYLDELYGLNLSGDMAVLSACSTGRSFKDVRSGNASLQRAFIYAGITSTLSSLWEIPDQSTQEIMTSFYENLKTGMTNGEAIRDAKRNFLKNADDPNLQAPYFWAGFVLSGQDQSIELNTVSNNSSVWIWVIISVSVIGLFSLFWVNHKRKKKVQNLA